MKIFKILFLFICVSSFAQTKVGTVDVNLILSKLPELKNVQEDVDAYGAKLDIDLNKKLEAYNKEVEVYKAGEATYTEAEKTSKQKSIVALEQDLNKFQQNGDKLMTLKRNEALSPLYNKIGAVLESISKAQGYTQILQINQNIVYFDENFDLTLAVLKDLGIEIDPTAIKPTEN